MTQPEQETELASVFPTAPGLAAGLVVTVLLALMVLSGGAGARAMWVTLTLGVVVLLSSFLTAPRSSLTASTLQSRSLLQRLVGWGLTLRVEDLVRLERVGGQVRVIDRSGRSHLLTHGSEVRVLAFEQALVEAIQARRLTASLTAKDESPLRCPYCHDDLDRPGETCSGCAAIYHSECLAEAGCGTLGCQERRALVPS